MATATLRREEPLVLADPDRARDVCFLPRRGEFGIEVSLPPKTPKTPAVYDDRGNLVKTLTVSDEARRPPPSPPTPNAAMPPGGSTCPSGKAEVQIDGVTRWDDGDSYPSLPLWTPGRSVVVPVHAYRWLVTPYQRTAYGQAGTEQDHRVPSAQQCGEKQTVRLQLEFLDQPWKAKLAAGGSQRSAPKKSQEVAVQLHGARRPQSVLRARNARRVARLLDLRDPHGTPGHSADQPRLWNLPFTIKPYEHENEQFGYLPDYPVDNQVYFDCENRPYVNKGSRDRQPCATASGSRPPWRAPRPSGDKELAGQRFRRRRPRSPSTPAAASTSSVAPAARRPCSIRPTAARPSPPTSIPGREASSRSFDLESVLGPQRIRWSAADRPLSPTPLPIPNRIWRRINDLELFVPPTGR